MEWGLSPWLSSRCSSFSSLPAQLPLSPLFFFQSQIFLEPSSPFQAHSWMSSESRDGRGGDTFRVFPETFKSPVFSLFLFFFFLLLVLFCFSFSPADSSPRDHGNHSQLHVSLRNFQQPDGAPRGGSPAGMHRLRSVRTTERAIPGDSQRDQGAESPLDWEKGIIPSFLVVNNAPTTCSMSKRKS